MAKLIGSIDHVVYPKDVFYELLDDYQSIFTQSLVMTIEELDKPATVRVNVNTEQDSIIIAAYSGGGRQISYQKLDFETGGNVFERPEEKKRHGFIPKDEQELWEEF